MIRRVYARIMYNIITRARSYNNAARNVRDARDESNRIPSPVQKGGVPARARDRGSISVEGFNERRSRRHIQVYNILYFTSHPQLGHSTDVRAGARISARHCSHCNLLCSSLSLSLFFLYLSANCYLTTNDRHDRSANNSPYSSTCMVPLFVQKNFRKI